MHQVVYQYLNNMLKDVEPNNKVNPHNPNAYRIEMGDDLITYFYYGPGEYDDDTPHYGIGSLHVHPDIVDTLRKLIKTRESKVMDMVADWFSEKYNVDIDEVSIYPTRKTPAVY
jgi:hypothetical protein